MDIIIHWGVFRHLRKDVAATSWILLTAIALDAVALGSFLVLKGSKAPMIIGVAAAGIVFLFLFERFFLQRKREAGELGEHGHAH